MSNETAPPTSLLDTRPDEPAESLANFLHRLKVEWMSARANFVPPDVSLEDLERLLQLAEPAAPARAVSEEPPRDYVLEALGFAIDSECGDRAESCPTKCLPDKHRSALRQHLTALRASRGVREGARGFGERLLPTAADVEWIENEIGMGADAWDMVHPEKIIAAAWLRLGIAATARGSLSERAESARIRLEGDPYDDRPFRIVSNVAPSAPVSVGASEPKDNGLTWYGSYWKCRDCGKTSALHAPFLHKPGCPRAQCIPEDPSEPTVNIEQEIAALPIHYADFSGPALSDPNIRVAMIPRDDVLRILRASHSAEGRETPPNLSWMQKAEKLLLAAGEEREFDVNDLMTTRAHLIALRLQLELHFGLRQRAASAVPSESGETPATRREVLEEIAQAAEQWSADAGGPLASEAGSILRDFRDWLLSQAASAGDTGAGT